MKKSIETKYVTKLERAWICIKTRMQYSAELGAAALAGRVAMTKSEDEVAPIFTCKQIYDFKAALRPILHKSWHECAAPRWLAKRCRAHLKQLDKLPSHRLRQWDVIQQWFRLFVPGSIWDHPGRIGENLILQPYNFNDFDAVFKAMKMIHVAVVSRPSERGFHHPETFLFEFEKSYPSPKNGVGWTADEGWG